MISIFVIGERLVQPVLLLFTYAYVNVSLVVLLEMIHGHQQYVLVSYSVGGLFEPSWSALGHVEIFSKGIFVVRNQSPFISLPRVVTNLVVA